MGPKEAESFPLMPRDPMARVPEHQPQSGKGNQDLSQSPPLNATEPSETGATVDSQLESRASFSHRGYSLIRINFRAAQPFTYLIAMSMTVKAREAAPAHVPKKENICLS